VPINKRGKLYLTMTAAIAAIVFGVTLYWQKERSASNDDSVSSARIATPIVSKKADATSANAVQGSKSSETYGKDEKAENVVVNPTSSAPLDTPYPALIMTQDYASIYDAFDRRPSEETWNLLLKVKELCGYYFMYTPNQLEREKLRPIGKKLLINSPCW
jgi:hypothetical protein